VYKRTITVEFLRARH